MLLLQLQSFTSAYINPSIKQVSYPSTISFTTKSQIINRRSSTNIALSSSSSSSSNDDDNDEFYPSDPASTTPQLLSSLWLQIANGCRDLSKGVSEEERNNIRETISLLCYTQYLFYSIFFLFYFFLFIAIKYGIISKFTSQFHSTILGKTHGSLR